MKTRKIRFKIFMKGMWAADLRTKGKFSFSSFATESCSNKFVKEIWWSTLGWGFSEINCGKKEKKLFPGHSTKKINSQENNRLKRKVLTRLKLKLFIELIPIMQLKW